MKIATTIAWLAAVDGVTPQRKGSLSPLRLNPHTHTNLCYCFALSVGSFDKKLFILKNLLARQHDDLHMQWERREGSVTWVSVRPREWLNGSRVQ